MPATGTTETAIHNTNGEALCQHLYAPRLLGSFRAQEQGEGGNRLAAVGRGNDKAAVWEVGLRKELPMS
jgi:hypothetical protein